jgi:hypothetical protein
MKSLIILTTLGLVTSCLFSDNISLSSSEIKISDGFETLSVSEITVDTFNHHGMPFNFQTNWTLRYEPKDYNNEKPLYRVDLNKELKEWSWSFFYLNKNIGLDSSWSGLKTYNIFPAGFKPNSWYRIKFSPDSKMRDNFVCFDEVMKAKVIEREGAW